MIGAAGTRANRLDALRDLLVLYPGEWHYIRKCSTANQGWLLQRGLRRFGDDRYFVSVRTSDAVTRVYATWSGPDTRRVSLDRPIERGETCL